MAKSCTSDRSGDLPMINYRDMSSKYQIDLVGTILLRLADNSAQVLSLNPPISITTFDTRDFTICMRSGKFRIRVRDLRGGQIW